MSTATTGPLATAGHVVVHRWQDHYAHYEKYIDHDRHPVTYVTTPVGRTSVPAGAAAVVDLPRTDDLKELRAAIAGLAARFGAPTAIVALKEGDLPAVARLRREWGTAGRGPDDLQRFLDKLVMARLLEQLGTAQPAFAGINTADDITRFAGEHGWPVIVKPRRGSASSGVVKLDGADDLSTVQLGDGRARMVQAYLPHDILHVDGLCADGSVRTWRASKYINTCLSYAGGAYLGSVEVDDPELLGTVEAFVRELLPKLSGHPWIFHLELFVTKTADGWRCLFLEVGSRVGGAEIPWIWREVHGIELFAAECALQLGLRPIMPGFRPGEPIGGYLLTPPPAERPCVVGGTRSMIAPGGPYAERVLPAGSRIPDADAFYEHTAGRFRFRGTTTDHVEAAIRKTAESFTYQYHSVVPATT